MSVVTLRQIQFARN